MKARAVGMHGWHAAWAGLLGCLASDACHAASGSYVRDVAPILQRHCTGCHHPGKPKGDVDLTSVAAMRRPGRNGAAVVAGNPSESLLLSEVQGVMPAMPKEGDPLPAGKVAVLERWIREGAVDDTPPPPPEPTEPPPYKARPVLGALDWSPDGRWLAVGGRGEVLMFDARTLARMRRFLGAPRKIDSVRFSPDGRRLAVAGGEPGVRGVVQCWDVELARRIMHVEPGHDMVLGVDWHPDGTRVACGGAERTVRVLASDTGAVMASAPVHSDWVLGVAWMDDGRRLVSGGRDRSLRLIDGETLRLMDVLNREGEPVVRVRRRPGSEQVAFAGGESRAWLYQAFERPPASDPGQDPNRVREFEAWPGGVTALAFSPDGQWIATAGSPPGVLVQRVEDGGRVASLGGHEGVVFGLAFDVQGRRLATAGAEGRIRVFALPQGTLVDHFVPVEVTAAAGRE